MLTIKTLGSFTRLSKRLLALAALPLLTTTLAHASGPVFFGQTIHSPGTYFVFFSQSGSGDAIEIASDDVTLFLWGATLRGDGSGTGILVEGRSNVHIYGGGGRITNFESCIEIEEGDHCSVRDLRLDDAEDGLDCDAVTYSHFQDLEVHDIDGDGVQFEGSSWNTLRYINSHHNSDDGIHLGFEEESGGGCFWNLVKDCSASHNGRDGITILDSANNTLLRNTSNWNDRTGIDLERSIGGGVAGGGGDGPGADENYVLANNCYFNGRYGIRAVFGSRDNLIMRNFVLFNNLDDLFEGNGGPCRNTWRRNVALSGGGNTGCLR